MIPAKQRDGVLPRRPKQAVPEASPARVVQRPVPQTQAQDARAYQLEQLRRRFSPEGSTADDGACRLLFNLAPSDPDFPFELDHLECDLSVPAGYPGLAPRLRVRNKDIPRGFSLNIERGWDGLVREKRGATLLTLINALDRNLETLLAEQKTETVKLTVFKNSKLQDDPASAGELETPPPPKPPQPQPRRYVPEPSFTSEQIAEAKARRAQEIRQLEARMGRLPLYGRSSDGVVYTLPLEPKRRAGLPTGLASVDSVQLIIPLLYPLQPLRILLNNVESEDAEGVEDLFAEKAAERKEVTLMSHVNFLAQNLRSLTQQARDRIQSPAHGYQEASTGNMDAEARGAESVPKEDGRDHIRVIPRPPEWCVVGGEDESSTSEDDVSGPSDEDRFTDRDDGDGAVAGQQTAERGTALTFPSVELRSVELLQVSILSLGVRCERCRTINEVGGLNGNVEKSGRCRKCTAAYAVKFRPELIHNNSARAGFIDAVGCTAVDLLPSTFIPTCATCSTPSSGIVSVRGDTTTNVCRHCHSRFTFRLPEVKFLAYTPGAPKLRLPDSTAPRRRTAADGSRPGEPLPGRGACGHYRRSYRWFRFSCCSKVHPCDQCHDAAEDHPHEWAERMVCGWCSREQRYAPESCAFCGRNVVGKRGTGFWEGGRGTRDKVLMRRGDKRKYRRAGAGEVTKARAER